MEDGIAEGGAGYECGEVLTEVFNGELTTTSSGPFFSVIFTPSQPIEGDSIVVNLDGVDYTLPKMAGPYGDTIYREINSENMPVFTNYPCIVSVNGTSSVFLAPSEGTYQVKVSIVSGGITTSECFEKAVKKVSDPIVVHLSFASDGSLESMDISPQELKAKMVEGKAAIAVVKRKYSMAPPDYITLPLYTDESSVPISGEIVRMATLSTDSITLTSWILDIPLNETVTFVSSSTEIAKKYPNN